MKLLITILLIGLSTNSLAIDSCYLADHKELEKIYDDYVRWPENKELSEVELLEELGTTGFLVAMEHEKEEWASGLFYMEAAAYKGHVVSMANLGVYFLNKKNPNRDVERAICWFKNAFVKKDDQSAFALYTIYSQPESEFFDKEKAMFWLTKSANSNYSRGLCTLGLHYMKGKFVARDEKKASDLFQKAAIKGNQACINNLAQSYYFGKGVEIDYCKAKHWLEKLENKDKRKSLRIKLKNLKKCES